MRHPITVRRRELAAALTTLNRCTPRTRRGTVAVIIDAHPAEGVSVRAYDADETRATIALGADMPAAGTAWQARAELAGLAAACKGAGAHVAILPDTETLAPVPVHSAALFRGVVIVAGTITTRVPDRDGPVESAADGYAPAELGAPFALGTAATVATIASRDLARPILTAVCIRPTESAGVCELAGTDSYRLAARRMEYAGTLAGPVLVPAAVILEGARHTDSGRLAIDAENGAYTMTAGPLTITGRLVAGDYPAYETLAPATEGLRTYAVVRHELAAVVDAAARHNADTTLTVTATASALIVEGAGIRAELAADGPAEGLRFGVNAGFLRAALGADVDGTHPEAPAWLRIDNELRPFYVDTRHTPEGAGLAALGRTLVMPVRLEGGR